MASMIRVTATIPARCALITPSISAVWPNGVWNCFGVKSNRKPARLLNIENSAMKTMMWLSTGASLIGAKTIRSIAAPPMKETMMQTTKATQNGRPRPASSIRYQAM